MPTTERLSLFFRIVFLKNGYWKLFSLIVAVLVYLAIRSEISHLRVLTVPVEVEYDPKVTGGGAIESVEPRSVQVTVRGSYSEVNQLVASSMRCVVRPKQKKGVLTDTVSVKVDPSHLRGTARGLRVTKIDPHIVVVKLDVPMSLRLAVAPPEIIGKARGRVQLVYDQAQAVVKGSRRLLSPLDKDTVQIQTDMIDVDGRSQSFTTSVKLYPPGDAVNATVEPSEMVVDVVIVSEKKTVRIERVPVVVSQPFADVQRWRTDPEWVDVDVTGRSEVVNAITFGAIIAAVNGNLPPASVAVTNEAPVAIHLHQGLVVDEARPVPQTVKLIPLMPLTPKATEAQALQ